jgi:hypothetical protein
VTGVTTGQTALPTATDSDDAENYLTVSLTAALQALANLFESATGHDHSGSGKGKPIVTAGIASGITLTAPHFTTPVVDSGGLTVTAGGLTVTAGGLTVTAGGAVITAGGLTLTAAPLIIGTTPAAAGYVRLPNAQAIAWRNAANSADLTLGYSATNRLIVEPPLAGSAVGGAATLPANPQGFLEFAKADGTVMKVPYYNN